MDQNRRQQAYDLVRSYSFEVEGRIPESSPSYPLSQTLVHERPNVERLAAPWRALLDPADLTDSNQNPITAVVAAESQKLREIWRNFQGTSRAADRLDIDNTEPTVEGMTKALNDAIASWDDKRKEGVWGSVKAKFHRFCHTVDSHKALINILPQSSEYVSIFSGCIAAIIQASVNHEGIIETVVPALCHIGEHIQDCALDLKLYESEEMMKRVASLYSEIFLFLTLVSEWVMKKRRERVRDSFNESLKQKFEGRISSINDKSQKIRDHASQAGRVEGRVTRITVDGISQHVGVMDKKISSEFAGVNTRLDDIESSQAEWHQRIAQTLISLLQQAGTRSLDDLQRLTVMSTTLPSTLPIKGSADAESIQGNLSSVCKRLEKFYDADRFRLTAEGFEARNVPHAMMNGLIEWLQARTTKSSLLWLQEEPADLSEDHENPMSMLAAKFVELATQAELPQGRHIPLISYFCQTRLGEALNDGNSTREAQGAVALAYALLRQMLANILAQEKLALAVPSVLEGNLNDLDGSIRTWGQAMGLLQEAVRLTPGGAICVIDGLHWLDDRSTEPRLVELIRVLREGNMKVLFTTSARSGALLEEIKPSEIVSVQDLEDLGEF